MTKKTINQAIAQTLIGINKANTDVKSANIGIKINGTRVARVDGMKMLSIILKSIK